MPTAEKAGTIEELRKRLDGATAAVLTEYRGLTVQQVSELRKQLKAASAEYRVVKNRLARVAIEGSSLASLRPHLTGPIGVVIARKDPAAVAKALQGFAKAHPALQVRVGRRRWPAPGCAGAQGSGGPAVAGGAPVAARGSDPGTAGAAPRLAPGAAAGARIHSGRAGQAGPGRIGRRGVTDGIARTRTGPTGLRR